MHVIREANSDDFPGLMALYRQLQPADPVCPNGEDRATFDEILATRNLHLFVLPDDNGVVQATCYLNIIPNITRSASPYGIIENVVTEERCRGQGLGKQMIGHALQFAWDRGCYKVMLQTGSKRASTHAFYRSCGFRGNEKSAYIVRRQGTVV